MYHQQSELFFFDQCGTRRKYKRFRKPTELLPFSLRLTGLSGAVKVEAYLKQQQQKAGDAAQGKEKSFAAENSETPESRPAGALNNFPLPKADHSAEIDGKRPHPAGGKLLNLPDIGLNSGGFNSPPAIKSFEQLEGDDDEEDTQRFLFEENKFASQNLLAQLGRLLDQIHQQQLEELEEIESTSLHFCRVASPVAEVGEDSIVSETIRSGGVVISLPDDLYKKLSANFEELSAGALYLRREWQTTSYREQAILQKRLGLMSESNTNVDASKSGHDKSSPSTGIMDHNKTISDDKLAAIRASESKDKRRQSTFGESLSKLDTTDELNLGSQTPATDHSHSDNQPRRESSRLSFNFGKKTRLEKFKALNDKALSEKKKAGLDEDDDTQNDNDVTSAHGIGQPTVINFSLLSKTCEEKGWILHQDDADDLERQTLLEWARSRLQQVIREKEEMKEKARELKIDGPLVTKFYGDTQREATMKYKKGVSWAKRWKNLSEEDKRPKFLTSLPDGTSCCYYPSGRIAMCASYPGPNTPGRYTVVYGDSADSPMLATFVASGQGCCYHKNGSIRFVSTVKFGAIMREDGNIEQKWKWPLGRLQTTIVVQLNNFINLRCVSQAGITLYFSCQNETAKFHVGMPQGSKPVKLTELGYLQTNMKFSSNAAMLSMKPKTKKKEEKRRRKAQKLKNPGTISAEVLELRQQELEEKFPERKELDLDAPWQMDLLKLQRKVKGLIFDWMEHYRVAVGISPPFRFSSRSKRRAMSHSARSVPGALPSGFEATRASIRRSPSAPPIPHPKGKSWYRSSSQLGTRPHSSVEKSKVTRIEDSRSVTIEVPTRDMQSSRIASKVPYAVSGSHSPTHSTPQSPFRCGVTQQARVATPPRSGCPVALRSEVLGEKDPQCRCDRRKIPLVTDLEYDCFITEHVPRTQLLVVSVTSSQHPDANPCDSMLDQLFHEKNRNRSLPCVQAQNDPFRLVRYDISLASHFGTQSQPLLLRRHNAVPGMFLMYTGGRLLFADHIFNGYGNAKKDFLKQIMRTRKDALEGKSLPADFRLSPTRGRSGPRAAWGGEIGGVKISERALNMSPAFREMQVSHSNTRLDSAATTASLGSISVDVRGGANSAASFVNFGLSIDSPYPMNSKKWMTTSETIPEHRRVQTSAW